MPWWKRLLAALLLAVIVASKGCFWLSLGVPGDAGQTEQARPCACTGEATCHCVSGSCCVLPVVPLTDSDIAGESVGIGPPKLCGSLGHGELLSDDVCSLEFPAWDWRPVELNVEFSCLPEVVFLGAECADLDPPVPKIECGDIFG